MASFVLISGFRSKIFATSGEDLGSEYPEVQKFAKFVNISSFAAHTVRFNLVIHFVVRPYAART